MSFGNVVFTNKGRLLRTKAELGTTLEFTRIGIGRGIIDEQPVSELTDLIDSVLDVDITNLKTYTNGQARIGGVFINKGLSYGFYWRELGLFANDPDNGEILYCYGNAGDLAEYIPADGGSELLEKYVSIIALIGNASNVTATINCSLVYATMEELKSKVDKVEGKGLSTEDYSTEEKNKLVGIEENAQANRNISDSITSSSSTTVASSKAVKQVNDKITNSNFLRKYSNKTSGELYSGTVNPTGTKRLNYDGYLYATKIMNQVYGDLAEYLPYAEKDLKPGDVLIWDNIKGGLTKTNIQGDTRVVGVYSDTSGFELAANNKHLKVPVGLAGTIYINVIGIVKNGDLLESSNVPGYAQAYSSGKKGTIVAKALESNTGEGNRIYALILTC